VTRFAIDSGPIVALLNGRDEYHEWTRETLGRIRAPLFTCEAVLSEAAYLVRGLRNGPDAVLELVNRGVLAIEFRLSSELPPVRKLLSKYSDIPMSLADACVVRMSELDPDLEIITLDDDFRVYRRHRRQVVPIIAP
jgi:predicted nucleic acid-binding protein